MKYNVSLFLTFLCFMMLQVRAATVFVKNLCPTPIYIWSSHSKEHKIHEEAFTLMPQEKKEFNSKTTTFSDLHWRYHGHYKTYRVDLNIPWWKLRQKVDIAPEGFYRSWYYGNIFIRA